MSAQRSARRYRERRRRIRPRPWYRRSAWSLGLSIAALAMGAVLLWPRVPAYADYADGRRPSVVFVWSDPTPQHPDG